MTPPPDAGTATAGRLRTGPAPRVPRRVSGPAAPARGPRAGRPGAAGTLRETIVPAVVGLPDSRVLDRLLRGRAWIALVAVALIGIVFMQVSLLKLNAGISQDVTASDALDRANAQLRADISAFEGEGRIQQAAQDAGLLQPAAGAVAYRDGRRADAARAVRAMKAPDTERAAEIAQEWRTTGAVGPQAATTLPGATPTATATTTTTGTVPPAAQSTATAAPSTATPSATPPPTAAGTTATTPDAAATPTTTQATTTTAAPATTATTATTSTAPTVAAATAQGGG